MIEDLMIQVQSAHSSREASYYGQGISTNVSFHLLHTYVGILSNCLMLLGVATKTSLALP